MTKRNNRTLLTATAAVLFMSGSANAEFYGLVNGRSADISRAPQQSVEVGVVIGDDDYQHLGARFNYKANPNLVVYGDLGQTDGGFDAELSYGLGVFYHLVDVVPAPNVDLGFHGSVHRAEYDYSFFGFNYDFTVTSIILEAQFSGKDAVNAAGNIFWNASTGLNRASVSGGGGSDTDLFLSGGITMETASQSGEFYGSVLYSDGLGFGAGYRHFLN